LAKNPDFTNYTLRGSPWRTMRGVNRGANWKRIVIAVLIGCAFTAALTVLQSRFETSSIPRILSRESVIGVTESIFPR